MLHYRLAHDLGRGGASFLCYSVNGISDEVRHFCAEIPVEFVVVAFLWSGHGIGFVSYNYLFPRNPYSQVIFVELHH